MKPVKASSPEGLARMKAATARRSQAPVPATPPDAPRASTSSNGSGFWNFVVAVVLVAFVIYLATKPGDRLTYWIKLLSWKAPKKIVYKIEGEHVSGEVNSDAEPGKQYEGQPKGGDVTSEKDSVGPIFGGILRWWQGSK